jgi:ectoine hydroxylase-related dioxygenase (phytanoyl-CoA dioxygenase family)
LKYDLEQHGFTVVSNFYSDEEIAGFKFYDPDYEFPFQEGDRKSAKIDFNFEKIVEAANKLRSKSYSIFYQKTYFKTAFESSYEMYHQDYFYRQNDGLPNENYLQAFMALTDLDHAPLNVFVGSHKLGVLSHTLGMERQGMGKYRVRNELLREHSSSFLPVKLKKGSVIFFDYQLVHGSGSNSSPFDQQRAVVQLTENPLDHVNPGHDRREFEKSILRQMLQNKG